MNIIKHDDPEQEYRVDIHAGTKQTGIHHFTARESEATETARRLIVSLGGDHGDIYQHDGMGGATYYDTVGVE